MSRKWKPGDVAMVTGFHTPQLGIVRQRREANGALEIAYVNGGFDMVGDLADGFAARPLVVIDPEDREQAARLGSLYYEGINGQRIDGELLDQFQAALREYANPTPPCGASLTFVKEGTLYRCSESAGHEGPHLDGDCSWTAAP